jgi:hypothetical protein
MIDIQKHGYYGANLTNPEYYDDPDDAPYVLISPDGRIVTEAQAKIEIESGEIFRRVTEKQIQEKIETMTNRFALLDDQFAAFEEVFKDARQDCRIGNWFGELVAQVDGKWYRASHVTFFDMPQGRYNIFSTWVDHKRVTIWYQWSWGALNGGYIQDETGQWVEMQIRIED